MRARGSYSSTDYEEAVGYKDGGRNMNPQRHNGFPTAKPVLQSADIDSDRALDRSNLTRLKNSYPLIENGNLSQDASPVPDWRRMKGEMEGHMRNTRWSGEGTGYPKSTYQEGPSNYFHGASNSRFGESPSHHNVYDVPKKVGNLERDRAELLRKLRELEDQLLRSGSVGEQGKQRHHVERSEFHHESFGSSGDWIQDNSSVTSSPSRMTDKRFTNVSPYHEKHPFNERRNVSTRNSYLSSGSSNAIKRYEEYADSHIPIRGTASMPGQYQEYSAYRSNLPLQSADTAVPRISGSPNYYSPQHQPDYYKSNLNSPLPVQSRISVNTRHTDSSSNPKSYHQKDAQMGYNSGNSYSPPATGGQINHVRWPSAMDSVVDEGTPFYPESTTPVKVKRSFHPIAGGSPFLTCCNCFELLQIRREIMKVNIQQQKIRCGACSSLTHFFVEGKKLVISIPKDSMEKSKEMRCGSNVDEAQENSKDLDNISNKTVEVLHTRGPSQTSKSFHSYDSCGSVNDEGTGESEQVEHPSNISLEETEGNPNKPEHRSTEAVGITLGDQCLKIGENKKLLSDDLNRSWCESRLMDNAPVLSEPNYASLSNKSLDAPSLLSADDSDDDNPEECAPRQEEMGASDDALNGLISPLPTISARREHHGDPPSKHAVYWFGTHSQIIRAQNEENDSEISSPRVNVVNEISAVIETETEVLRRETPKANSSVDTKGSSPFEDPPKIDNGGFVAENVKDRVLRLARSIHYVEEKCDVRINEQPIPDHLVKKAEDLAGPILPGNYWYDFRAGFWGVTGGPCLGIIPPRIQQFNYPILNDCSGGTTGVVVNGRELHKNDLALLHSRGLSFERGKSYIVEISGRVQDEKTGEELKSLGPLAPTIERLKRGFGMRVSKQTQN